MKMMDKFNENVDSGRYIIKSVWYKKWDFIHNFFGSLISVLMAICIGVVAVVALIEFGSVKTLPDGTQVNPVQVWGHLEEDIYSAMINLNPEKGVVVWIGWTISREKAITAAQSRKELFNDLVEEKHQSVADQIRAKVHPAFKGKVDVYYIKDTKDGVYGIFIVPEGTKVIRDNGKPYNDSSIIYERI